MVTEIRIYPDKNGKFNIPDEYRSDVVYGTTVKALSTVLYSEGVMSNDRIAAFLNAAGNGELGLSAGSVYGFCRKFASNAEGSIQNLETELLNQEVVLTDATTVTVNGEQNYVRNFSIGKTVIYRAMKSKAIDALKKIDFLKNFQESWYTTMKRHCIILEQTTVNAMSISSVICVRIRKKPGMAGQCR